MERRQILAVLLMFLVLGVYQLYWARFQKPRKVKKPPLRVEKPLKPQPPKPPPTPRAEVAPPSPGREERLILVKTRLYEATFTARGAALTSFKLLDYPKFPGKSKEPVDLVPKGKQALLVAFKDPAMHRASTEGTYSVSAERLELSEGRPAGELTFTYNGPDGAQIIKRLTFRENKYAFDLDLYVKRRSGAEGPLDYRVYWARGLGGGSTGYGAYTTISRLVGKKRLKDKPGKLPEKVPLVHPGRASWSAIQTKYFVALLAPRSGAAQAAVYKQTIEKDVRKPVFFLPLFGTKPAKQKIHEVAPGLAFDASGEAAREQVLVFAGPKYAPRLKAYGEDIHKVIDYGWFGPLSRPLLSILRFLNGFIGNYGFSIILLTVIIKLLFFPLSIKQQKNMAQMTKLQPRLKALQERYKNDKQKLNQEIMGLYRSEKINPMGGCLPLLIQFPVIIALYRVLGDALELRGAPFVLWITDLSVPDTIFFPWLHVLPVVMGATMLIQNFISPASAMGGAGADPRQQQMLKFMPLIFLFIFWSFPAGLNLYWTVYTILGIGEQFLIKRQSVLQEARAS